MAQPTVNQVHVNVPLTNISIAYRQSAENFIADKCFPNIPSDKKSNVYFRYDRGDFMRDQMKKRAPGTESAGSGYKLDATASYDCDDWALHKDVPDQIRANADSPLDMDRDATLWLAEQAMISREIRWVASFFITGVWAGVTGAVGTDVTGVASSPAANQVLQWDNVDSDPTEQIIRYCDIQQAITGQRPNKIAIGRQAYSALLTNPSIVERIKFTSSPDRPAVVSRRSIAALWELDEVLVASGVQATSPENKDFETSLTTAFIAGKKALLFYAPSTPSILRPSAGYTFSWTGYSRASGAFGEVVSKFRMEHLKSDRVEMEMPYVQKIVAPVCGTFFNTIVG